MYYISAPKLCIGSPPLPLFPFTFKLSAGSARQVLSTHGSGRARCEQQEQRPPIAFALGGGRNHEQCGALARTVARTSRRVQGEQPRIEQEGLGPLRQGAWGGFAGAAALLCPLLPGGCSLTFAGSRRSGRTGSQTAIGCARWPTISATSGRCGGHAAGACLLTISCCSGGSVHPSGVCVRLTHSFRETCRATTISSSLSGTSGATEARSSRCSMSLCSPSAHPEPSAGRLGAAAVGLLHG